MGQKQFRIRVYIGRDKDGKKQYINCYGNTQREAEKKALEVRKQGAVKSYAQISLQTLSE